MRSFILPLVGLGFLGMLVRSESYPCSSLLVRVDYLVIFPSRWFGNVQIASF